MGSVKRSTLLTDALLTHFASPRGEKSGLRLTGGESVEVVSAIRGVSGNQRIMAIFSYPIIQTSFFASFCDFVYIFFR